MKHSNLFRPNLGTIYIILLLFSIVSFQYNIIIGAIEIGVVLIIFLFQSIFNTNRNKKINEYIEDLFRSSDSITSDFVLNSSLPLVVVKDNKQIIWYNSIFSEIFAINPKQSVTIKDIVPNFPEIKIGKNVSKIDVEIEYNGMNFNVIGTNLKISNTKDKFYSMLYFIDTTEKHVLQTTLNNKQTVFAKIVVDNFDECINGLTEADKAVLAADTDKHIYNWAKEFKAVINKLEKDKYLIIFEKKDLENYIHAGFEKLRQLTDTSVVTTIPLTLSIGVGISDKTPVENEDFSNAAIDMALGRGGDQVVIKDENGFSFYGGLSKEIEKRTKVRSRVMAGALRELIESKDSVVVIGHKTPDLDLLGSALGIYRACKTLERKCYILLEEINPSIVDVVNRMKKDEQYDDVLITKYQAESILSNNGILMVIDTHRVSLASYPELTSKTDTIALIDHHRKSADFIENTTLVYHETYASSTAELIIEILQYMTSKVKLSQLECDALYAGMLVDTKNFTFKTGVRTFEAASYLRRCGLNPIEAKEFTKSNLETYVIRSKIVKDAIIYRDKIAISNYVGEEINDLSVIAQAADDLINIKGISTTFVLYFDGGICKISARSVGDINVQIIMEKMGGGGHQLAAGTQLNSSDIHKVQNELLATIDEYLETNDRKDGK